MSLPSPSPLQPFCEVSALDAGFLDLPDAMFITTEKPDEITKVPSLAFLITHASSKRQVLFDLGIRKDLNTGYPPVTSNWISDYNIDVPQDIIDSLAKGNLSPRDIEAVLFSHIHWDHTGDPSAFTKATFLLGDETETLLRTGYPIDQESMYAHDLLPPHRTQLLKTDTWTPVGPFPRAFDYWGDGSLYIVDAPGHLPGHLNVLARTSVDGAWIYLAADSAHFVELFTGEAKVSVGHPAFGPHGCAHSDRELAELHISRIRELWGLPNVLVLFSHDAQWYRENRNGAAFWPGHIPPL
ncbi:hypothetical protein PC9H_010726 [Pleurotus ostreatus]|uniref:Metallo-beta-lactamase domain-containing protein n=2 Tax=Pleurotus TaxID=5320 RepID=A0A8H6ZKE2_PLEOS|nr:uncharacterized protein PC9H_010726 [Pleurotus ostreatus]KAF7422570.1 hypothetical protein PC9H_010726 [Pleurotus ostreatus]KAG9227568.1 hypothetical protein CCMSSC00406_0000786 [Pleurotus cornucopiae]KAJ8691565.1 hypothetical protein PTI98_011125 [Pleurotus ostreatus]